MKSSLLLATFVVLNCSVCAMAGQFTPPSIAANADPTDLMRKFRALKGTPAARNNLEIIDSRNLPVTVENINLVIEALAGKATIDEHVFLVRILGSLHRRNDPALLNGRIREELKKQAFSTNRKVARAATFAISGTAHYADSAEILERAKADKIISGDEYAGETARAIRFVTQQKQGELVSILARENSGYGLEVLVDDLNSLASLDAYSLQTQKQLYALLRGREPHFPMAIGAFGYFDALKCAAWLKATSRLHEKLGLGSSHDHILKVLSEPSTDPRKIVGFLSSPDAQSFWASAHKSQVEGLLRRAREYSDSFPQNFLIREFVDQLFVTANQKEK